MLDYINRIFTCSRKRTQQQEVDVGHRRMLLDVLSGILNGRSLCHNALRLQQQELNCAKISHRPWSDAGIVPASNIKVGFFKSGQVHWWVEIGHYSILKYLPNFQLFRLSHRP